MQSINSKNWTYSRYENEDLMAFISFGLDPVELQKEGSLNFDYYVTVLRNEEVEIFQKQFKSLALACLYLNNHYRDWNFTDQTIKKSGCSTCSAH